MKIVSRINKSLKILSLTAALGVGFSLPAFALDGDAFFARVQTEMKKSGYDIKAGKISVDGANVNVSDVNITGTEASNEKAVAIKEINFQDVEEDKDGGYLVGRAVIDEFRDDTSSDDGLVATISGAEITKILLKSDKNEAAYEGKLPFEMMSIKKVALEDNGKSAIIVDDLSFGYSEYEVGKLLKFGGELGNLKIHLENLPNNQQTEAFTKMGFNQLDIQGNYKFAANLVDGHVDVTFQGNMNDAGQLNITISLAGLTKDLADELVRLTSEANTATDKQQQIIAMSIVGLIQQLSLNSIDIKFVDNSITNKIIDLQKEPDMKREDFVTQLKMFSSFGLMSLQHPDFAEKASTEIGKYLDNPENIEITAKPDHSTPFAVITSTAMTSKKDLIDLLKVDVKANQ